MNTDNHHFIVKTNKDVDAWMDGFYVDGHKSDFRLHCQWAWQEQERRHNAIKADLISALQALLGKAYKQNFNDSYPEILAECEAAIAKARGEA